MDEAAYVTLDLLTKAILPVLVQSDTCLIAITTPRSSDHYFSRILRMKDPHTDKPLVNVVRLGEPCEACKKGEMPWMCSHRDEDPPWKSRAKSRKFEPIYLLEGLEHVHLREQFGIDADDRIKASDPASVKALDEFDLYRLQKRPPVIFLTADPSGHGNSGYALCGSFFDHGRYVVSTAFFLVF